MQENSSFPLNSESKNAKKRVTYNSRSQFVGTACKLLARERMLGKIVGIAGARKTSSLCKVKSHLLTRFCMYINVETDTMKEDISLKKVKRS